MYFTYFFLVSPTDPLPRKCHPASLPSFFPLHPVGCPTCGVPVHRARGADAPLEVAGCVRGKGGMDGTKAASAAAIAKNPADL